MREVLAYQHALEVKALEALKEYMTLHKLHGMEDIFALAEKFKVDPILVDKAKSDWWKYGQAFHIELAFLVMRYTEKLEE